MNQSADVHAYELDRIRAHHGINFTKADAAAAAKLTAEQLKACASCGLRPTVYLEELNETK